jgi:hypothetical protein
MRMSRLPLAATRRRIGRRRFICHFQKTISVGGRLEGSAQILCGTFEEGGFVDWSRLGLEWKPLQLPGEPRWRACHYVRRAKFRLVPL